MGEIELLNHPAVLLLFGAALCMCLFDKLQKSTRGCFTIVSSFIAVAASAYALILGVSAGEVLTVLLLFLCMELEGWK